MPRILVLLVLVLATLNAQERILPGGLNRAGRLEWFRDQGFGMFIHWSVDSQTGVVISHSLAGADEAYTRRFFEELPKTFRPHKFDARDWAALARLAGMRYVVFTAKHHSGFAMWDTHTTDFGVMHTPFRRDIVREVLDAFRAEGISAGLYFSPDDFWWLWKHGIDIQRLVPGVQPSANPGLLALDQAQVRELMSNYGPVDVVFFDGEPQGLRELAWQLQPQTVVTRGAMQTPELYVPGIPFEGAWETCFTMGTAWQYQPQNERYKRGGEIINLLVETRAKGGNLLLNVGPKPDGELPIEQEERLREIALWMQVNQEAIYATRPWAITNEGPVWFTKAKDADTLYAIVKQEPRWVRGEWREFVLKSVKVDAGAEVSVLGQNGRVLEYRPDVNPKPTLEQRADGLHVRAMFTLRLQDNSRWPNPVVLKITHATPALKPPKVVTTRGAFTAGKAALSGELADMADQAELEVGVEYRSIAGLDASDRSIPWMAGPSKRVKQTGAFTFEVEGLDAKGIYEYRVWVKHPLLTLYGGEKRVVAR